MGLFDQIGDIFDLAVKPIVSTVFGGPSAGVAALGAPPKKTRTYERSESQMLVNPFEQQRRNQIIAQNAMNAGREAPSFFGGLGETIGNFGRDIGGFIEDVSPLTNLFGGEGSLPRTNSGTATSIDTGRPEETASSGEILGANLGMGGLLLNQGRSLIRSPAGQTALGFGAGAVASLFGDDGSSKPRITRRMKSDVRKIYMMAGMNPNATAQILNNLGTYPRFQFDASLVFFILTKRFRNDGPVVTKAAVRKTKSTLRRMKGVVDMYNSVCKPTTRRTPARRAAPKAVQLIKN